MTQIVQIFTDQAFALSDAYYQRNPRLLASNLRQRWSSRLPREAVGGLYTMVSNVQTINEQMNHFWTPQPIGADGLATIWRNVR